MSNFGTPIICSSVTIRRRIECFAPAPIQFHELKKFSRFGKHITGYRVTAAPPYLALNFFNRPHSDTGRDKF
jgi:hypothetical protein